MFFHDEFANSLIALLVGENIRLGKFKSPAGFRCAWDFDAQKFNGALFIVFAYLDIGLSAVGPLKMETNFFLE